MYSVLCLYWSAYQADGPVTGVKGCTIALLQQTSVKSQQGNPNCVAQMLNSRQIVQQQQQQQCKKQGLT